MALDLPEAFLGPLAIVQAGLGAGRVTARENLHLTLAFLGDISEQQARDFAQAMALLRMQPVDLALQGLDLFGGRRPSILFAAATGAGLAPLHTKLVQMARDAGIMLARERFRPHVTLARFSKSMTAKDQRRLGEFLVANGAFSLPPAEARRVTLWHSRLRPEGAIHEPLAEIELTG